MSFRSEIVRACLGSIATLNGEAVIMDSPANLMASWEAVGGWLALSPRMLVFQSHGINIQCQRVVISTSAICDVWPTWTRLFGILPVFPSGIAVQLKSGRVYRFVVWKRQTWTAAIRCVSSVRPLRIRLITHKDCD